MSLEQQPPFLICVPIAHNANWPGLAARETEARLDDLGNPASAAVEAALDATNVIHFLSLSVVWDGTPKDRPILVADIAGDGTPQSIIAALVDKAGVLLMPVFQAAAGVESVDALQALLQRYWVTPVSAAWTPWPPHRTTGLGFQGTPGLTVERIRADERIARQAIAAVDALAAKGSAPALAYVSSARTAAGIAPNPKASQRPLSFVASAGVPTGTTNQVTAVLGLVALDWSFLLIIILAAFLVNVNELLAPIMRAPVGGSLTAFLTILFAIVLGFILNFLIDLLGLNIKSDMPDNTRPWSVGFTIVAIIFATWASFRLANLISTLLLRIDLVQVFETKHRFDLFADWVALVLGLLSLVLFLALVALLLVIVLRLHEKGHKPCDADPDPGTLAEIMRRENLPPYKQNHMIGVSQIPVGFFRRFISLPLALYAVSVLVRAGLYRPGFLSNVGTIHFAQWVNIPGTWKLVFVADYDGSWQSYLEDFITLAPQGATAIWSNTDGFPETRLLVLDGAADGDRFKRWGRRQMIPTRFWYSAYPDLTATDIRLNADIRLGLEATSLTSTEAAAWVKLFGSAPRPVNDIETDQIQGLALGGYRNLREGALLAVSFPDDAGACRRWLAGVTGEIDFGDAGQNERAMAVALSARGLRRLGLGASDPLAAQFSPVFTLGMANETRASALGDIDGNAPDRWVWGGPDHPVDAVLLIYAVDLARLKERLASEISRCGTSGLWPISKVVLHRWPSANLPIREPFGFVDGVSQPSIRGLRSSRGANRLDLLEPGEFILGYQDGRQKFPSTPQVLAADDHRNLLPDLPPDFPPPPTRRAVRDLGRNGSYLVIRQLKQDVAGFRDYVNRAATNFPNLGWGAPDWVAAKMVGRWPNGSPLVLSPDGPDPTYDPLARQQEFLFGRDDPQGLACPFGAHIRRSNPRDQFDADSKQQMSITNRHRIIRRGRSYVDSDDSGSVPQGLMFMCLNADIERQFEFLQQTWLGSTAFSSLRGQSDPLTGMNRGNGAYTIPTHDGPRQLTGMPSFVSVIGGGYFFLPSRQALAFLSS